MAEEEPFENWLAAQNTIDTTVDYKNCEAEYKAANCDLIEDYSKYMVDSNGRHLDSYYGNCQQKILMSGSDDRNPSGINQPPQDKFGYEPIFYYEQGYIDTLKNCPRSENRMAKVENGDTTWITPTEPLPCDAVLRCQSDIAAQTEAARVDSLVALCGNSHNGCELFQIKMMDYLGPDIRYPNIATSFGDTGKEQAGPIYSKVVVPQGRELKIRMQVQLDSGLGTLPGKARMSVYGGYDFDTHSSSGPVTQPFDSSFILVLDSAHCVRQANGHWLWTDTLEFGKMPTKLGIMSGGIQFILVRPGEDSIGVKVLNNTLYVTYGVPQEEAYIHKNYIDSAHIVVNVPIDGASAISEKTIAVPQYKVENKLTNVRLAKILDISTYSHIELLSEENTPQVMKRLHEDLLKLPSVCVFDTLKALKKDSALFYEVYRTFVQPWYSFPSRIWMQFDVDGYKGHCQEYSFALDNMFRILGLQQMATFRPVQLFAQKNNCVGIKNYSVSQESAVWTASINKEPLGYWVFSLGLTGQEYFNSLIAEFATGKKTIFIGYATTQFPSIASASENEMFTGLKLVRRKSLGFEWIKDANGDNLLFDNTDHGGITCSE